MNIVQWLNSLDELLFELMSWIVFFPVTLWRIARHPLATMRYAEEQLRAEPDLQYDDSVSPPIMLILTVVVMQTLGLAIDGVNPMVASHRGLAALVNDNTTLLLLRLVLFGLFALVLASLKVARSSAPLNRGTLKPAFYAQCYAVAPFALLLGVGVNLLGHNHPLLDVAGLVGICSALLFYGAVQIVWFSRELKQSYLRSFIDASIGMVASVAMTLGLALLFR